LRTCLWKSAEIAAASIAKPGYRACLVTTAWGQKCTRA
jgi:hypothetical protein